MEGGWWSVGGVVVGVWGLCCEYRLEGGRGDGEVLWCIRKW